MRKDYMFWKKRSYESFFNQFFKMNRLYFDIKALIVYDRLHFFFQQGHVQG